MKVDTLEQLSAAFLKWRDERAHQRAPVPEALLRRARHAAQVHGEARVLQSAKLDRRRLCSAAAPAAPLAPTTRAPAYSRLELSPPSSARPFAEVELTSGTKVRLFTQSREALELLASLCSARGAR